MVHPILQPILELAVIIPGCLLGYLPMKHHQRLSARKLFWLCFPLLCVLCAAGGGVCYLMQIDTIWVMLPMVVICGGIYMVTLQVSPWKSINVILAICAVFIYISSLARAIDAVLEPGNVSPWLSVGGGLVYVFLCCVFVAVAWHPATHAVIELLDDDRIAQTWYFFWILPVVLIGLNLFMIPTVPGVLQQKRMLQEYVVINLILLGLLSLFYAMFCFVARSLDKNARLQQENQFLAMQQAQYDNLLTAIEETRQARHDMRHHFNTLSAMVERQAWVELQRYLNEAQGNLPQSELFLCENPAVNGVASYYGVLFSRNEIPFSAKLDLPALIPVSEMDICLVLSNLLENALEASLRTDSGKRYIRLEARLHSANVALLTVENASDADVREVNGVFQSTKRQGNGIGIQSVRRIVEKNGGYSRFAYENGVFTANVILRRS